MIVVAALTALAAWAIFHDLHDVIGRRAFLVGAAVRVRPGAARWRRRSCGWTACAPNLPSCWPSRCCGERLAATYLSLKLNVWLAAQVGDLHAASARSAVFIAPWVEETTKAAVIFAIVLWRRHDFNAVVAGVVYGGLVGIGFAFTENIVYYGQLFQQVYDADKDAALGAVRQLFFWRGLAAPFVHPMFTMMTGAGIGFAVRHRHVGVRILAPVAGFCAAALLHMGYNTIASFAVRRR
ncbi:MAG: PrsW family intramembrane metalloprotease [Nocardioidaceae bacterium]